MPKGVSTVRIPMVCIVCGESFTRAKAIDEKTLRLCKACYRKKRSPYMKEYKARRNLDIKHTQVYQYQVAEVPDPESSYIVGGYLIGIQESLRLGVLDDGMVLQKGPERFRVESIGTVQILRKC